MVSTSNGNKGSIPESLKNGLLKILMLDIQGLELLLDTKVTSSLYRSHKDSLNKSHYLLYILNYMEMTIPLGFDLAKYLKCHVNVILKEIGVLEVNSTLKWGDLLER